MASVQDSRCIYPGRLTDTGKRGTAQAVVSFLIQGKGKDADIKTAITPKDLVEVRAAIEARAKGKKVIGLEKIRELNGTPEEVEQRLSALESEFRAPIVGDGSLPAFSSMVIDALWSPGHKETARAVIERFGQPGTIKLHADVLERAAREASKTGLTTTDLAKQLNIPTGHFDGKVLKLGANDFTPEALFAHKLKDPNDPSSRLVEAHPVLYFDPTKNNRAFVLVKGDPEPIPVDLKKAIIDLKDFMSSGRNGLCNFGPVNLQGQVFNQVILLEDLPYYPMPEINRPEQERERGKREAWESRIAEFEARFENTSYDRIYLAGDDDKLYLAVNGAGALNQEIARGAKGSMPRKSTDRRNMLVGPGSDDRSLTHNVGEVMQQVEVLYVRDVPNNAREAATQQGKTILLQQMSRFIARKNEATPLLVTRSPGSTGGPPGFVGGSGAARMGVGSLSQGAFVAAGTTGGATLLASVSSALSWGSIATVGLGFIGALAGLTVAAAGAYWIAQRLTPKTYTPIVTAAGLVANNEKMRADEF